MKWYQFFLNTLYNYVAQKWSPCYSCLNPTVRYWLEDPFNICRCSSRSWTLVERKLLEIHLVPKVNRMLVFLAEMPCKLHECRWQAGGDGITRICMGDMLEGRVVTLIVWWVSRMLYNQEDFGEVLQRFVPVGPMYVQLKCLQPFLALSLNLFWVIKKKRSRLYFIHECCCLSLFRNTTCKKCEIIITIEIIM